MLNKSANTQARIVSSPTIFQAFEVWLKIGFLSFGGPAAQIALMHREIVDKKKWLTEQQFLNALSFCMLLPGPEAMQLATYSGWRLHGTVGGLIAGLLFVIPGATMIFLLALIYALYGDIAFVDALFLGIKAAVIVIVVEALVKVSKRALRLKEHWVIAGLAFVGIFFLDLPFPLIILAAAIFGFTRGDQGLDTTSMTSKSINVSLFQSVGTILVWLAIWWVPLLLMGFLLGDNLLVHISVFFSKLAVVTFGGAYAVLAYLGQDVVSQFGWLTAGEMMDGLGLAETTPGPLILVNEFVGFLAAYKAGGIWFGLQGALVTLWATFAPCFLWIFTGAPYIDWIGSQPRLKAALQAITAAVVGVILNLSIWLSLHVFFEEVTIKSVGPVILLQPSLETMNYQAVVLCLISAVFLFKMNWGILRVLFISSLGGLVITGVNI
jgi:chromate transporter